jgi:hypothetical protein
MTALRNGAWPLEEIVKNAGACGHQRALQVEGAGMHPTIIEGCLPQGISEFR